MDFGPRDGQYGSGAVAVNTDILSIQEVLYTLSDLK